MPALDLSTAVLLYDTTVYSGGALAPAPGSTYVEFIFPTLVFEKWSTYRVEVDYTTTGTNPSVDLYSSLGPTEADADNSGWWMFGDLTGSGSSGTMVGEFSLYNDGTGGGIDWFRAFGGMGGPVEPYVIFDGTPGLTVTGVRVTDITPPTSDFETVVLSDDPISFYRLNEQQSRYIFDSSVHNQWGDSYYNASNVYPGWSVPESGPEDETAIRLNGSGFFATSATDTTVADMLVDEAVIVTVVTPSQIDQTGEPQFLMSRSVDIVSLAITPEGALDLMWGEMLDSDGAGPAAPYYSPKHYISDPGVVVSGVKQHIAVKISATLDEVKFLVNGVVVDTISDTVDAHPPAMVERIHWFCARYLDKPYRFIGVVHEAALFDSYLPDEALLAQVDALALDAPSTDYDLPVTDIDSLDTVTYPWDEFPGEDSGDWSPPQTEGIRYNWGYIVPDEGALYTPGLGPIWDINGFEMDRSHASLGADFDPRRAIETGSAIGTVEADGSVTFTADPFAPGGHWDDTAPDGVAARFGDEDGTVLSEGVDPTNPRLVVHGYPGGTTPRFWINWATDGGVHRAAFVDMTNYGDYTFAEFSAPLPADFPVDRALAGERFTCVFTIWGGMYYGKVSYVTLRFGATATEPEPEEPELRPHYHHTLRAEDGTLIRGATVTLLLPGTDTRPPDQEVFVSATGEAQRTTRWYSGDGIVDFYVDHPASFDILITPLDPGTQPFRLDNQWAGDWENRIGEAPNARGVPAGFIPRANGFDDWNWDTPGDSVDSVDSVTGDVVVDAESVGAMRLFGAEKVEALTRAAYDALPSTDPDTVYLIRQPTP